jgi:hypothetical protein
MDCGQVSDKIVSGVLSLVLILQMARLAGAQEAAPSIKSSKKTPTLSATSSASSVFRRTELDGCGICRQTVQFQRTSAKCAPAVSFALSAYPKFADYLRTRCNPAVDGAV